MLKPRKLRRAARGVGRAIEEGLERVGTATTRGATRQKGRRRNVVTKNDPETGKLINITRGQRVRRGAGVTAAGTGATGAAATAASASGASEKTKRTTRKARRDNQAAKRAAERTKDRKPMSQADRKAARTGVRKNRAADQATKDAKRKADTARFQKDVDDLAQANIKMNKAQKAAKAKTVTKPAAPKPAAAKAKPEKKKVKRVGAARKMSKRKFAGGGMASKMSAKGGARGGKKMMMPGGMKAGGSASKFPDMTGDGKVTQKDILKARGVPGFSKGDLVVNMVRELSKLGRRAFEKQYGKTALNKAIKETNKASGLTPTKTKKTPTQKMLAEADRRAEETKYTRQTPAAKKQRQVRASEKRMERMKNGGMMKSKGMAKGGAAMKKKGYAKGGMTKKGYAKGGMAKKGYSKGGAVRGKPRGVGVALRGYGKALK